MKDQRMQHFLTTLAGIDGYHPLSDAKMSRIDQPESIVIIEETDEIVAVGVVAVHEHTDGSSHWAVETTASPGLRFPAFESQLLEATLGLVPGGEEVSVWSRRVSLDLALKAAGFSTSRQLAHYTVNLPVQERSHSFELRAFRNDDTQRILAINASAFAGHREAAAMNEEDFEALRGQAWFSAEGLVVAVEDSTITGFCWTRVHSGGDGEIFRIAVDPSKQGSGIGSVLLHAGLTHLADDPRVKRGTLWVDLADGGAVRLYERIGMEQESVNREFVRQPKR
ncbi:MAG: GNAT family N-acetyltransferase [Actinomycetota bacterium]